MQLWLGHQDRVELQSMTTKDGVALDSLEPQYLLHQIQCVGRLVQLNERLALSDPLGYLCRYRERVQQTSVSRGAEPFELRQRHEPRSRPCVDPQCDGVTHCAVEEIERSSIRESNER